MCSTFKLKKSMVMTSGSKHLTKVKFRLYLLFTYTLYKALNNERLSALPERLQAPSEPNHNDLTTAMDNIRLSNQDAPRGKE